MLFTDYEKQVRWIKSFVRFMYEESGGKIPLQQANDLLKAMSQIDTAMVKGLEEDLTFRFFFPSPSDVSAEEQTAFLSAVKADSDINQYIARQLAILEKQYEEYLKNIRSWKKMWQELSSK